MIPGIHIESLKRNNNGKLYIKKPWGVWPDLIKISRIILSYPLADSFEFRVCLAGICLCSQNINKYSNKPAKGCERITQRFSEDLITLVEKY